jgi:N-acetylneuraminic acid mutarotase
MITSRVNLGAAVVKGKIYAIGGQGDRGMSSNEMYDPAADNWTTKASMTIPRESFGIAVHQNKIYAIGGQTDSDGSYYDAVTNANQVYDPTTGKWENRTAMPTRRYGMCANTVDGKIYVIGGKNSSGWIDDSNEAYDSTTDTWTVRTPIPTPVSFYASAVLNNKIYVIGGYNGSEYTDLTQIYNPETDTWSRGKPIPTPLMLGAGAAATTGVWAPKRIYVIGAYPISGSISGGILFISKVQNQIYDPETDTWSNGGPLLIPRIEFGVAVVNDILYVIGGTRSIIFPLSHRDNQHYTPYEYGTIPAVISVSSPQNTNYTSNNVSLAFTVNKPALWTGYSLDGQDNVTVTGNTTLPSLTSGLHTIRIYAKDAYENTGASKTITFNIIKPFPSTLALTVGAAVAVGVGAAVYFKKRKH